MTLLLVLLGTAALLVLPGAAVARASGLPTMVSLGVAVPVTYGLVALAVTVLPPLGITWTLPVLVALTALVAVVLIGARLLLDRRRPTEPAAGRGWSRMALGCVVGCCLTAAAVGGWVADKATIGFTAFNQGYDATFHANAVRLAANAQSADPTVLAGVAGTTPPSHYFYPTGYHALSALLAENGVSVERAMDVQAGLLVLWLAGGLAVLAWALRSRPALAGAAALLACAVVSLPYDLFLWGPLFPYVTAAVLVPGTLSLAVLALDRSAGRTTWAVLGLVLAGMITLHTSVALATVVFIAALLVQRILGHPRRSGRYLLTMAAAAVTAALGGASQVKGALIAGSQTAAGDSLQTSWPVDRTIGEATGELLTFSAHTVEPQLWLAAALLVGLISLGRLREWWWFLAAGAFFGALFVLVASVSEPWVHILTGYWWNDRYRFAALAVPPMVLLAAGGLVRLADALAGVLGRAAQARGAVGSSRTIRAGAAAAVLAVIALLTGGFYAPATRAQMAASFGAGPSAGAPERAALQYLADHAKGQGQVLNDPFDGSAWMWAAVDVRPVFGQALFFPADLTAIGPDRRLLYTDFHAIDTDPAVRAAVDRLDVHYVFVGDRMLNRFIPRAPGLTDLDSVHGVQLVYRNGQASVYRVLPPESIEG